jgi:F-type H+-transporting ATPase subunit b
MFVTPGWAQESHSGSAAPAEGEAHGGGDAHTEVPGEKGVFPPFDPSTFPSQILWLAITFGLFYLFLKKVVLPRIGSILEVRRDRIAQDLDQAARMKEEADASIAAYEQELAEARKKANAIGQEANADAKKQADAERKGVEAALEQRLQDAEKRIGAIKTSALKEVGTIAEDTAHAIVQELIGGKTDKAAVAAAVRAAGE